MNDISCSYASTCGEAQFQGYCNYTETKPKIECSSRKVQFGKGSGRIYLAFAHFLFSIEVHVLHDIDVPFLLSLRDVDAHVLYYDNLMNRLNHKNSGIYVEIHRRHGHPIYKWCSIVQCLFIKPDLRR